MALAAARPAAGPTLLVRSISASPLSASPSSASKAARRGQAAAATRGPPPGEPGSGANIQAGTGEPPIGDRLRSAAAIFLAPSLLPAPASPVREARRPRPRPAKEVPANQRRRNGAISPSPWQQRAGPLLFVQQGHAPEGRAEPMGERLPARRVPQMCIHTRWQQSPLDASGASHPIAELALVPINPTGQSDSNTRATGWD